MDIRKRAEELESYTIETRHWLHQHAELSWKEYETTRFIAQELGKLGLEPQKFDGGHTGLYAMIRGGKAGGHAKTIMLRADIDALPIKEQNEVDYISQNEGVMHACGHDTHAAMLLTAAKILVEMQEELPGNVKLLFQGGEETSIGAKYYLDQGVLDDVDAVYACHVAAWLDAPYISVDPGPRMAGSDEFSITVHGVACHGGMSYRGHDAIVAASAIVTNLQQIISRQTDSQDALVITVGTIKGGNNYNVVCDTVEMHGTVRTYSNEIRMKVPDQMREVAAFTAKALGCTAEVEYLMKTGPVIHDNEEMNGIAKQAVLKLYGEAGLKKCRAVGGGDDFAYFLEQRPGIFAFIGGENERLGCIYDHHHPKFNVDESVLKRGAAMYAQMAVDYLHKMNG